MVVAGAKIKRLDLGDRFRQRHYRVPAKLRSRAVRLNTAAFEFDPKYSLLAVDRNIHSSAIRYDRNVELQAAFFDQIDDAQLGSNLFIGCGYQINRAVELRVLGEERLASRVCARERAFVVERSASVDAAIGDYGLERRRVPLFE